jgi:flagellar motor protein MotB
MDSQKKDLDKNLKQERESGAIKIQKLDNDVVKIVMTGQTAFETDSATIKPGFTSTMDKLSDVVIRYGKTALSVSGHTDSRGYATAQHRPVAAARAGGGRLFRIEGRQSSAPVGDGQRRNRADREQRYRCGTTAEPACGDFG